MREVSLPWEGRFNLHQSEASRDFLVQAEVCLSVSTYSRMSVVEVSSMFRHDGFILRQDGFRTLGKERKPMDPKFVGATPRIDARIIRMRNFADTNRRADRVHIFDLSKISADTSLQKLAAHLLLDDVLVQQLTVLPDGEKQAAEACLLLNREEGVALLRKLLR